MRLFKAAGTDMRYFARSFGIQLIFAYHLAKLAK